jgi:hypothetical protein
LGEVADISGRTKKRDIYRKEVKRDAIGSEEGHIGR